jgi:toxin ParE1/3/4
MVQLIWANRAIEDLNSIAEYIALDSEQAAKFFVQELIKKANTLASHPGKGRLIPKIFRVITGKYYTKAIGLFIKMRKEESLFLLCIIKKDYYLK